MGSTRCPSGRRRRTRARCGCSSDPRSDTRRTTGWRAARRAGPSSTSSRTRTHWGCSRYMKASISFTPAAGGTPRPSRAPAPRSSPPASRTARVCRRPRRAVSIRRGGDSETGCTPRRRPVVDEGFVSAVGLRDAQASATAAAADASRDAIATTSQCRARCMAGITFFRPIAAVESTPQRSFLEDGAFRLIVPYDTFARRPNHRRLGAHDSFVALTNPPVGATVRAIPAIWGDAVAQREDNRRQILTLLRVRGPLTQANLARLTGLSPSTVSTIVAELQSSGAVKSVEDPNPRKKVGRPGSLIALDRSAGAFVGIDIEHERFMVLVADAAHNVLAEERRPLQRDHDAGAVMTLVAELIDHLAAKAGVERDRLSGAGVGLAGPINLATGQIHPSSVAMSLPGVRRRDEGPRAPPWTSPSTWTTTRTSGRSPR